MASPHNQSHIDPQIEKLSPYFIHPSDGPSWVSVSPKLNGTNYHSWPRSMCRALGGKIKLEFIDGIIDPIIENFDPLYRAWNQCNMLIHSLIIISTFESIVQYINFM